MPLDTIEKTGKMKDSWKKGIDKLHLIKIKHIGFENDSQQN